jgi:hypothetical protein
MSCDRGATALIAISILSTLGCVQSGGIDPPPAGSNVAVVDGEEVAVDAVDVFRGTADEYSPGRRIYMTALIDDLFITLQIGDLSSGAQAIVPFAIPDVRAATGDDSEVAHVAISGTLEVIEGDGRAGTPFEVAVTQLVLQQTCDGTITTVASGSFRGNVAVNDELLADAVVDVGALGHIAGVVEHPTDGTISFIGAAQSRLQTLGTGAEVQRTDAFDACVGRNRVFTLFLDPTELAGELIVISLNASSAILFRETDGVSTNIVSDSRAVTGAVKIEGSFALQDNIVGELRDLELAPIDGDVIEVDEPRASITLATFRTVMEAP